MQVYSVFVSDTFAYVYIIRVCPYLRVEIVAARFPNCKRLDKPRSTGRKSKYCFYMQIETILFWRKFNVGEYGVGLPKIKILNRCLVRKMEAGLKCINRNPSSLMYYIYFLFGIISNFKFFPYKNYFLFVWYTKKKYYNLNLKTLKKSLKLGVRSSQSQAK